MESWLCRWRACNLYLVLQSIFDVESTMHVRTHSANRITVNYQDDKLCRNAH
jgi:hypothetical protein